MYLLHKCDKKLFKIMWFNSTTSDHRGIPTLTCVIAITGMKLKGQCNDSAREIY